MDRGTVGQSFIWKLRMDRVLMDRVYIGTGCRWTELYLEITFVWSLIDRVGFGNDVGTESLMDRFANGQSLQWAEMVWIES